ncbi:MAG: phage virion morphogenesis protein [Pseudomonadota bacterium]|nr:phage virion morphogenesis protein [Pseudomonadota bacterium]
MTQPFQIIVDDEKAQRWFGELLRRGSDLRPVMDDIGEMLLVSTQERFRSGIAPDGQPWAALADGSGRSPLFATGTLHSLIAPHPIPDGIELVASAKQARWHQEGTDPYVIEPKQKQALAWPGGPGPRKRVNHPGLKARPFMGISAEDERSIEERVTQWLALAESPNA